MARKNESKLPKLLGTFAVLAFLVLVGAVVLRLYNDRYFSGVPSATQPNSVLGGLLEEKPTEEPTTVPETTAPQPEHVVTTATISVTGDMLMHLPVINSCEVGTNDYDFTPIFKYLTAYTQSADYAVANLETTLAGLDNGYKYSGYPMFNCPDDLVEDLMAGGFDMLLTANNHCYDTSTVGLLRTLSTCESKGMDTLGTYATKEATKYSIHTINDISVGMMAYTYATATEGSDLPAINGIPTKSDSEGLINTFNYNRLDSFYTEVEGYVAAMKEQGAEAIVIYMHWGNEYQLFANELQKPIAQKLCDLGVDVIVGGHPHVVQPMELLTSTADETHKTVCIYSLGNAISNQRRENMNLNTGNTEDGVLFSFTFSKYSDGVVALEAVEVLPYWVNHWYNSTTGKYVYEILPLDEDVDWQEAYDLIDSSAAECQNSYDRTMKLVKEGLTVSQEYLAQEKAAREAAYLAAVQ